MRTEAHDTPQGSTAGDTEVVVSMTARFGGALLVLALVAGTLISTLVYPPAAIGSLVAAIALATCLGCVASRESGPNTRCPAGRRADMERVPLPGPVSRRNSRDAMPGGGRLTVETKNVELDEAFAVSHPPTRPGRYVMLAVTDTGWGMDAETQSHIWVDSEIGVGTTFRIYLPLLGDAAPIVCEESPFPAAGGSETILVVEDEASLRGVLHDTLADNGSSNRRDQE